MVVILRHVIVALLAAAWATQAMSAEPKDYNKLAEAGFNHWMCAAYGTLAARKEYSATIQKSFVRGSFLLVELFSALEEGKAEKTNLEAAPKDVNLLPFPGPPLQFRLGYVWAQVEANARRDVVPKSSSGFFVFDSRNPPQEAIASKKFEEANCADLE